MRRECRQKSRGYVLATEGSFATLFVDLGQFCVTCSWFFKVELLLKTDSGCV